MNPFLGWPDSSVPLIFYDPRELGSLILIWIVPMERTPPPLVSFPNPVQLRHWKADFSSACPSSEQAKGLWVVVLLIGRMFIQLAIDGNMVMRPTRVIRINYDRFCFNIVCVMIVKLLLTSTSRPLTVGLHNSNATAVSLSVRIQLGALRALTKFRTDRTGWPDLTFQK